MSMSCYEVIFIRYLPYEAGHHQIFHPICLLDESNIVVCGYSQGSTLCNEELSMRFALTPCRLTKEGICSNWSRVWLCCLAFSPPRHLWAMRLLNDQLQALIASCSPHLVSYLNSVVSNSCLGVPYGFVSYSFLKSLVTTYQKNTYDTEAPLRHERERSSRTALRRYLRRLFLSNKLSTTTSTTNLLHSNSSRLRLIIQLRPHHHHYRPSHPPPLLTHPPLTLPHPRLQSLPRQNNHDHLLRRTHQLPGGP